MGWVAGGAGSSSVGSAAGLCGGASGLEHSSGQTQREARARGSTRPRSHHCPSQLQSEAVCQKLPAHHKQLQIACVYLPAVRFASPTRLLKSFAESGAPYRLTQLGFFQCSEISSNSISVVPVEHNNSVRLRQNIQSKWAEDRTDQVVHFLERAFDGDALRTQGAVTCAKCDRK